MLTARKAKVLEIVSERPGAVELLAEIGGRQEQVINYPGLTGDVVPGDQVLLNTTAVDLGLGTGGLHFVVCSLTNPVQERGPSRGRIMKLRYTPFQHSVPSVEEDDAETRERMADFRSLDGMPVICCELHSQIAPVAAALKALTSYRARIAYVMTDGAALPIALSRLAHELRQKDLLDVTVTCGQAFGGDIEAINLYTALIAAKEVTRADAAIVCQGPGNAGTASKYGFSGIEQGEAINACGVLGGTAVAVVRVSFADRRERHRGISHHTLTVLEEIALSPALIALPELPDDKARRINEQLAPVLSKTRHQVRIMDGKPGLVELARSGVGVTTMGRSVEEDVQFFLAASAAGALAADAVGQSNP